MFIIAGGVAAALVLLYIFLLAPGRAKAPLFQTALYAHRGLHSKVNSIPENSLPAFSLAAQNGYGMELDIQLTADDKVVVFHDDNLKRACGIDKNVIDCTYQELCGYRLFGTKESIPLFTEVLSLVGGRGLIIVELKNSKKNDLLCAKAAGILDAYDGPFVIESFNPMIVGWFKKNRPGIIRGQLATGFSDYHYTPKYQSALLTLLLLNVIARPHFVAFRHEDSHHKLRLSLYKLLGGKLVGWTIRDENDMEYCMKRFDAIIFENFRPKKSC